MNYDILDKLTSNVANTDNKKKTYQTAISATVYTQADFRNDVNTEEDLKRALGRKWKTNLVMLGSFVDKYQYITGRKELTPIALSSNSSDLLRMFKSQQNAYNFLKTAIDVDLLKCVNDKYRFSIWESYSKQYIYNKNVQKLIKDVIAKYSVNFIRYLGDHDYSKYKPDPTFDFDKEKHYNIRFCTGLRIPVMTDEECITILHKKYPQLQKYMDQATVINEQYLPYNPEQRIKFMPNIGRGEKGYISSIGIRATSQICNMKAHDIQPGEPSRHEYLCDYFNTDEYYEYDVKSSIYRISHLVNHGVWVDDDIDFYSEIYGKEFETPESRDNFKLFCQRVYFRSPRQIMSDLRDEIEQVASNEDEKSQLLQSIENLSYNLEYTLGSVSYRSEIFLHESCIYMDVYKALRDMGYNVVQVYDGFYCDQDFTKDIKKLLEYHSYLYYHTYCIL